ncbi:hypothetical protein LPJ76_006429, partial [Coemansia sp. RSA 638]
SRLIHNGMQVLFEKSGAYVYKNKKAILYAPETNGLYAISANSAVDKKLEFAPTIMDNSGSKKFGDQ